MPDAARATPRENTERADPTDRPAAAGTGASVEALLRRLETLEHQRLDGVRRAGDKLLEVGLRVEGREHEVGHGAPVASARAADADAQSQEVLGAEVTGDRAQAV